MTSRSARSNNVSAKIVVSFPGSGGLLHSLQQSARAKRTKNSAS